MSLEDDKVRRQTTCPLEDIDASPEAVKFDTGKPRMELIPPDAMIEIAKVFTMGADKYEARNWEKGTKWGRANGALLRHLMAWMGGEDKDPESGLWHMAHIAWNAICLLAYQIRGVGVDDRFKILTGEEKEAIRGHFATKHVSDENIFSRAVDKMRGKKEGKLPSSSTLKQQA